MSDKYLIESNGQTYGPADVDQLIQWVAEGRIVAGTTLIHTETAERRQAIDHPELRSWFGNARPAAPDNARSYPAPPSGYPQQPTEYSPTPGYQQAYRPPDRAGYAPTPVLGQGYGVANDSGSGSSAQLPAELQGLNFGAFAIPLWWSIFNKSYLGLLLFVPCIGLVMPFVLLFKGNEWAWQNRQFHSIEQFKDVQRAWSRWGIAAFVINVIYTITVIIGAIGGGGNHP